MLIETSGSNERHDEEKLNDFLEKQMSTNAILDGVVVNEPSKINNIWQLREKVPSSLVEGTYCHKYDISLPLKYFYEIVKVMRERIGNHPKCRRVTGYGHIGDSNLHLNIQCEEYDKDLHKIIEPFVYEYTSKLGGSISAEHGIGFLKTQYLQYSKKREAVQLMKTLKTLFDPKNILNPYKVLPETVKDM